MTPNVSKKPRIPWLIRVAFWLSAPAVQPRTPQDATDVDLLREQLEAAQQTLIEIAQEGYERVLQKRYEETLEQFDALTKRVDEELRLLERWAGEQNAGNAFAEQVRYWALSRLEKLNASNPASIAPSESVGEPRATAGAGSMYPGEADSIPALEEVGAVDVASSEESSPAKEPA